MRRAIRLAAMASPAVFATGAALVRGAPSRLEATDSDEPMYLVRNALKSGAFTKLKVLSIREEANGAQLITMVLPSQFHRVGARAQHTINVRNEDGSVGQYAPVSRDSELGVVQVLAVGESDGAGPLGSVTAGDVVEAEGPTLHDSVATGREPAVGIVTDASGAATAFQAVQRLLEDPRDFTEIRVLYEAGSDEQVALRNRFDAMSLVHPRFKVHYTATQSAGESWDGFVGEVGPGMLARTMPPPSESTQMVVAGSDVLRARLCGADGALAGMKYSKESVKCMRH